VSLLRGYLAQIFVITGTYRSVICGKIKGNYERLELNADCMLIPLAFLDIKNFKHIIFVVQRVPTLL